MKIDRDKFPAHKAFMAAAKVQEFPPMELLYNQVGNEFNHLLTLIDSLVGALEFYSGAIGTPEAKWALTPTGDLHLKAEQALATANQFMKGKK